MAADDQHWPNLELQDLRGSLGQLQARMSRPELAGRRRGARTKPTASTGQTVDELFRVVQTDLQACLDHPYNQPKFVTNRDGANKNAIGPMRLLHKKMLSLMGSGMATSISDGDIQQIEDLLSFTIKGLDPEHPFVKPAKEASETMEHSPEPILTGYNLRTRPMRHYNEDEMFDEAFDDFGDLEPGMHVQKKRKKAKKTELEENESFNGSVDDEEDERDEGDEEDDGDEDEEDEGEDAEMVDTSE